MMGSRETNEADSRSTGEANPGLRRNKTSLHALNAYTAPTPLDIHQPAPEQHRLDAHDRVVEFAGGNKSQAAAILGIGRTTLYRILGDTVPEENGGSESTAEIARAKTSAPSISD